jgi:alpha-glucosidase
MVSVLKFWLNAGVDGFRIDAVPQLFEDEQFRDEPPATTKLKTADGPTEDEYAFWDQKFSFNLPQTLSLLEKFRNVCDCLRWACQVEQIF